jgi:CMP-N,N'-diacetyllegionaminic acid synthase
MLKVDSNKPYIVAIIPARSGSKGVPGKNIRKIHGHTLLAYSINAAKQSKLVDRIIVSTDSAEYAEMTIGYGAEAPFLRPNEISRDNSTDLEFFLHAIDWLNTHEGKIPEYFVHLRPTTPLRDSEVIDSAIKTFVDGTYSSLRSVHLMSESAYKAFEVKGEVLAQMCSGDTALDSSNLSRQSYPKTYKANGYVDIVSSNFILTNKLLHGSSVYAFITEKSYEVDEEDDILFLEYSISMNRDIFSKLFPDG